MFRKSKTKKLIYSYSWCFSNSYSSIIRNMEFDSLTNTKFTIFRGIR